ncbi:OmpA family protein [Rhizobium laguerreae]|nr:OmpA family protein [Rhizobium laguerreae]
MRGRNPVQKREEEEESVFISMADMTVSFLFILMILLAFFASQFHSEDTVPRFEYDRLRAEKDVIERELLKVAKLVEADDTMQAAGKVQAMKEELERLRRLANSPEAPNQMELYNAAVAQTRKNLLTSLKERINEQIPDVNVSVSANFDALQFRGDGLFDSGSDIPTVSGRSRMRQIATILDTSLSCYSLGPRTAYRAECNPGYALIDALQVEGHTDNVGGDDLNMNLSARRAASIYSLMTEQKPELVLYENRESQPVLSVAGFGKGRPMQDNQTKQGQDANRRIDLRFIMVVPSKESDIDSIKSELTKGAP